MGKETVERVASVMRTKRRELINQPLDRIWDELASAAVEAVILEPVAWRVRAPGSKRWSPICAPDIIEHLKKSAWEVQPLYALLEK